MIYGINCPEIFGSWEDSPNSVNTMTKVRKIVKAVEEMDGTNEIKLGFSSIIVRKDPDLEKDIKETNAKLTNYCIGKRFIFVDNANIKENCLNNSKLHLNRKGTTLFTKNIYKSFSSRFEWNPIQHPAITNCTNQPSLNQNIPLEKLKELRLDNPKNLTFFYLNIHSVRNKFDSLQDIVMGKVDILIVAETKIDASFLTA